MIALFCIQTLTQYIGISHYTPFHSFEACVVVYEWLDGCTGLIERMPWPTTTRANDDTLSAPLEVMDTFLMFLQWMWTPRTTFKGLALLWGGCEPTARDICMRWLDIYDGVRCCVCVACIC